MTAAQQLSLGFPPEEQGRETWRHVIEWARRAVDAIGHKHVAYALDIAPSTLTDALKERDGKCLRADHLVIIAHLASPGLRAEYLRINTAPLGFDMPTPTRTKTDAEKLRIVLDLLERGAPFLLGVVSKEIGS
jgi:hypothetical protein